MAKAAKKASKTAEAAPEAASSNGSTQGAAPSMKILGQYVKDLSFETKSMGGKHVLLSLR